MCELGHTVKCISFFGSQSIKSLKAPRHGDYLNGEIGQQDLAIFLMFSGSYGTYETGDIYFQDSAAIF